MTTIKQHLRQRLVLHTGHPSGALGTFPIVKEYDGNETVAFNGVKIGASGVSRPADPKIMAHWLNVSVWDVSIAFTGTAMSGEWPAGWSINSALEFQLATGRTATINEAGDSVSFDSETPITKRELYKGGAAGAFQQSRIVWGPWEASAGTDPVYTREAGLEIAIVHGAWGHHNIDGEWMLRLDVDAFERANEASPGDEYEEGGVDLDEGSPPAEPPNCAPGYAYRPGTLVYQFGAWYWVCEIPTTDLTHEHRLLTDPDAEVDAGEFFAEPILCRAEIDMEADYSLAPVLEVTIAPAEYYEEWD